MKKQAKRVSVKPRAIPTEEVAAKLRESMALHRQANARRRAQPFPDVAGAKECLRHAAALRQEAHALDQHHKSPAWQEEQSHTADGHDTHEAMMAFYRDQGVL